MTDWHGRMQRSRQLARALGRRGYRCFYLNPHLGRQFESLYRRDPAPRLAYLEGNVFELHARLPLEPVFHHRLLNPGESAAVAAAVRQALQLAAPAPAVQIVSLPVWMGAAKAAGQPILYDCHDLLEGLPGMAAEVAGAEPEAVRAADGVVFSARELMERFPDAGWKAALVTNGVDAAAIPEGVPAGERVAGYVGAIEDWFDVEMIRAAAEAHRDCRFVVVGRVENRRARALGGLPNVELAGEAPHERLAEWLGRFRVGLIPFRRNPLTEAANPIKLYEYFRRGLPVVSSRLREVEAFGDLVYLASTPEEFARQLGRALAENDAARVARRQSVAAGASWDARAAAIEELIAGMGGRR